MLVFTDPIDKVGVSNRKRRALRRRRGLGIRCIRTRESDPVSSRQQPRWTTGRDTATRKHQVTHGTRPHAEKRKLLGDESRDNVASASAAPLDRTEQRCRTRSVRLWTFLCRSYTKVCTSLTGVPSRTTRVCSIWSRISPQNTFRCAARSALVSS